MLRQFLREIRAKRVLSQAQAQAQLSQWTVEGGQATRKFTFGTFEEASNFMLRFSEYSTKIGTKPRWSNVYNWVNVTLENQEFGNITEKEVESEHNKLNQFKDAHGSCQVK